MPGRSKTRGTPDDDLRLDHLLEIDTTAAASGSHLLCPCLLYNYLALHLQIRRPQEVRNGKDESSRTAGCPCRTQATSSASSFDSTNRTSRTAPLSTQSTDYFLTSFFSRRRLLSRRRKEALYFPRPTYDLRYQSPTCKFPISHRRRRTPLSGGLTQRAPRDAVTMTSTAAPPTEEIQRPLSEAIAAATRSVHAKLNKLIIARLPLAIPPLSADPSIYVSGLLHIAPIYITFESLWKTIVESPQPSSPGETRSDNCGLGSSLTDLDALPQVSNVGPASKRQTTVSERTQSLLTLLYLPGLMRSDRLRSDIGSLTGWSPEVVDEQIRAVSGSGRLAEFTRHARRIIEKKPHVLLAYSYILFMALFAGGRFIRATLESAGSDFWERVPSPISPSQTSCQPRSPKADELTSAAATGPVDMFRGDWGTLEIGAKHSRHALPLSFFHFATALDGEDLKKEFKKRLAESEGTLTARERHDVIQEAVCIFDNMLLLVNQLDDVCETNFEASSTTASWTSAGPGGRLRDSLVVTRERRAKTSSKGSGDSDGDANSWLRRHARHHKSETEGSQSATDVEGQPPACCPASRSMRFDAQLTVPDRKGASKTLSTDGAANLASSTGSTASRQRRSTLALMSNIILVVGLAAIVGMFFLTRRLKGDVVVEAEP